MDSALELEYNISLVKKKIKSEAMELLNSYKPKRRLIPVLDEREIEQFFEKECAWEDNQVGPPPAYPKPKYHRWKNEVIIDFRVPFKIIEEKDFADSVTWRGYMRCVAIPKRFASEKLIASILSLKTKDELLAFSEF